MRVLMLYANGLFDSDLEEKSIAGTQTVFISLSRALQMEGCEVFVHTETPGMLNQVGRIWAHLDQVNGDLVYDLMIVNVSPHLLERFSHIQAHRKVLWIHNEAKYLFYWKRLKYLIRYRPMVVFSGEYHRSTMPFFIPTGGRKVIPFGLNTETFCYDNNKHLIPSPRVYFTSNPLRSLRWLVDLWVSEIHPIVPHAELHIFSGWKTYGAWGEQVRSRMQSEIDYAHSKSSCNIVVREVLPKKDLFLEMQQGRAMFYKGDRSETFCLAVAEAQAMGLPAVVCDLGSMKERVVHEQTGFVAKDDNEFVDYALKVLTDDLLWNRLHHNALKHGKELTWSRSAKAFMEFSNKK
jgi:glycosyltransferase involved in cell wall biosynthesis